MQEVKQTRSTSKMPKAPGKCPWINVSGKTIGLLCNKTAIYGIYCTGHANSDINKQDSDYLIELLQKKHDNQTLRLQRLEDLYDSGRLQRPDSSAPIRKKNIPLYPASPLMVVDEDYEGDESNTQSEEEEDGSQLVQMFQSKVSVAPNETQELQKIFDSFLLKINLLLDSNNIQNPQSRTTYRKIIFKELLLNDIHYAHFIRNGKLPKK